jgi:uncharacterized repeat protein (TIGR03847 family)
MPRRIIVFDPPDRFITGTIGQPGNRTFFLQAVRGSQVVSVALEKVQVSALAERLAEVLAAVHAGGVEVADPESEPEEVTPLEEPLIELFRVGTLTLTWDGEDERVVVEARSMGEDDEEEDDEEVDDSDPEGPDILRVRLTARQAFAFVKRAVKVVGAGRPPCPLCGEPLNPEGHICPRRNGYVH